MVKKLSIIGVINYWPISIIFHSTPLLFLWVLVLGSLIVDIHVHHFTQSNIFYRKFIINLQIYSWDYLTYSCYTSHMRYLKSNRLVISSFIISPLALIVDLNTSI
jgi:hypothetical protein